jgi:mycofactocin glycosyltransferase
VSASPPLPAGFRVELDPATRQLAPDLLFGGSPARIVRLTAAGQAAWREIQAGPVTSRAAGLLARQLTDSGLAHPRPPAPPAAPDVTVIIPARDRPGMIDRCLAALGAGYPVIVVDDGSADPAAVAAVASRRGATLIRRDVNGGPGAARNTALGRVTSEFVAFLDSDCLPRPGWIENLAGHFADPLVGAVAPRVTAALAPVTWCGRYATACSGLDLGSRPGRVAPRTAVAYVPTAALVCRVAALVGTAGDGNAFDPAMRVGEDVDLVWRLHEAGWRVRYDPQVHVGHTEPASWRGLLARRFRYGTSAAPLALRHPGAVAHLVLHPWPAVCVAALLAKRPATAAAAFGAATVAARRTLRRASVPADGLVQAIIGGVCQTWLGAGRYSTQLAAPLLAGVVAWPGGRSAAGRRWRRAAAASLVLAPPIAAWAAGTRALDPVRFALGRIADDIAYGAGVWSGCLSERTTAPVRPAVAWHPLRIEEARR